ncbi:DUF805 domain-containing protein [Mycetocola zhadangensis]|uniref:DUF805 domain-containing protein n=1 Tax=Mycetocola zhadangensis TaxID=1164595 RepID=A0A3L7ISG1_9MICO|nr:DUF805 domain-containing protein [Mycetocola zhadangensis]RLQ81113.1 DUF805 domain-containing protein [Mycetocola zhadangensis]GGF04900.1 hypothetical protein GCM10011313_30010 [Mycetocola zhadangensis]
MTSIPAIDTGVAPIRRATVLQAMAAFVSGAFRLRGRASRSEYWWWMLANIIVLSTTQLLVPVIISGGTPEPTLRIGPFGSWFFANLELFNWHPTDAPTSPVAALSLAFAGCWLVLTVIPGFAVAVRRLHDSNLAGWWALLVFNPLGSWILLLFALRGPRAEGARFDA